MSKTGLHIHHYDIITILLGENCWALVVCPTHWFLIAPVPRPWKCIRTIWLSKPCYTPNYQVATSETIIHAGHTAAVYFDKDNVKFCPPEIPKPWMNPVTTLLPFDWSATGPRQIFNWYIDMVIQINQCFRYRRNKKWFEDDRPLGACQCNVIWTLEHKGPALLACYQH